MYLSPILLAASLSSPWPCTPPVNFSTHPWCDASQSLDNRVAALIAAMPLSDIISSLSAQASPTGGSSVLDIPPTSWWQEATHGAATRGKNTQSTFFPMPSHTVQAFNTSLISAIARTVGMEGRAIGNIFAPNAGWGFWAPNVNPVREPRWGRAQEVMGEDVGVCSAWAAAYVHGLQEGDGEDLRFLQVAATAKHFAAYDFEGGRNSGQTVNRGDFDARVTLQDLSDSYLPPFQTAVEAGVSGVMAAYTAVNGVPSTANRWLLTEKLNEWATENFTGYITGDCGAVEQVNTCNGCHNFTATNSSTVAAVLDAGLTMDCGRGLSDWTAAAILNGAVDASDAVVAAARNLRVRFRLGAFDDPALQPRAAWGNERICTPAAAELSLEAAEAGVVLLKNDLHGRGLPLNRTAITRLALVGGNANDSLTQMCSYYSEPCGGFSAIVTPLAALTAALPFVDYVLGCSTGCGEKNPDFASAVKAASAADATLIVAGLNCALTGEGNDRASIALPGQTDAFIVAVCAAAAPRPCVLAIATGSSLDISTLLSNENVSSIISIGYAGPAGGTALARILLGDASPPAGRLAATWFRASFINEVSPLEMNMRPGKSVFPPFTNPGHTHRFYVGENMLLPFGFGLSYTTWNYSIKPFAHIMLAQIASAAAAEGSVKGVGTIARGLRATATTVVINVTNTGNVDSDDVVLAFVVPPGAGVNGTPLQELVGWSRVYVAAGATVTVNIDAPFSAFTLVDSNGVRAPRAGKWIMRVGVKEIMQSGGGFKEMPLIVLA
jgi:beta-glucosidase-like glycosyl hydrolase